VTSILGIFVYYITPRKEKQSFFGLRDFSAKNCFAWLTMNKLGCIIAQISGKEFWQCSVISV
ncbi:MAG: hypothetical protein IJ955_04615, partial [Oscillospiraceae bacterium]|nr:hypothetical protein [Oscillospiraceae bacterium]